MRLSLDDMIIISCAFRYALGRRTYVVKVVVDRIMDSWDDLDSDLKGMFVKEILEFEKSYNFSSCDKQEWYRIVDKYKESL